MKKGPIIINGQKIELGQRVDIDLPVAQLYTHTPIHVPVQIVRGDEDGPTLFISGAIHGDELNGIEIIREVLEHPVLDKLKGTLIFVPIANIFGLFNHSRYLPDRRDLNRSFPGSPRGSLAQRLAHLLMTNLISHATHVIDLHTGAIHRPNFPQIRISLNDKTTLKLAKAFGAPVIVRSNLRRGSLRDANERRNIPTLVFEAGEALRFDRYSIQVGVMGILKVMQVLGMIPPETVRNSSLVTPMVADGTKWIRAGQGGIVRGQLDLGSIVEKGDILGVISDPFGKNEVPIKAPLSGVIIGQLKLPLVNKGDALFHLAHFERHTQLREALKNFKLYMKKKLSE